MVDLPMMCVRVFTILCTKRYFRLCMKNVYNTFLQQQQQQQRKQTMFCARALSFVRFCPGSLTGNSPHTEPAKKEKMRVPRTHTTHTAKKINRTRMTTTATTMTTEESRFGNEYG